MANKELRFEQAALDFHERLRNGYLTMAKADPNRFRVINANQDISTVSQNLIATWNNFEKENRK